MSPSFNMDPLREAQLQTISIIERVCSVVSLLSCLFIISTFLSSRYFHKPINRLVFYASFGNMISDVAALMARSYVNAPTSAGCQIQAFLISTFMPADCFWTLAMALNVYLTFYWRFDAAQIRRMEIPYFIFCYGLPLVPALVMIFVESPERGRMYGNAGLWCWITNEWDIYRIAIFYAPIWVVIFVIFFIYLRTFRRILQKRKLLRNMSQPDSLSVPTASSDGLTSMKTVQVLVTSEAANKQGNRNSLTAPMKVRLPPEHVRGANCAPTAYSVTISSNRPDAEVYAEESLVATAPPPAAPSLSSRLLSNPLRRRAVFEANSAAWNYSKCAILFFTAVLVTWVPPSANRAYSLVYNGQSVLAFEYMSAFVLPLQGFWNALIYIVTSWKACQMLWADIKSFGRRDRDVTELVGYGGSNPAMAAGALRGPRGGGGRKGYENESMTELASSRADSNEGSGRR